MNIRQLHLILILFAPFFATSALGQQINAKYISASGSQIKLQLTIKNPAPQNVIIEQYVPVGTRVVSTNPRAKQTNLKNGVVKWLLKGLKPGKRVVSMKVSPPLSSNAKGKLTYRHPRNGTLVEKTF